MQDIDINTLEKAAGGDMQAFEEIYRVANEFVYTVAKRVVNNSDKAADVTQEVFLKIHKYLRNFQFRSSFKTWLYRITVNTAISTYKKNKKLAKETAVYDDTIAYNSENRAEGSGRNSWANKQDLQILVNNLSANQKACILLREIEGLSYQEIAKTLRLNINTVRSRLKRARAALIAANQNEVKQYAL